MTVIIGFDPEYGARAAHFWCPASPWARNVSEKALAVEGSRVRARVGGGAGGGGGSELRGSRSCR